MNILFVAAFMPMPGASSATPYPLYPSTQPPYPLPVHNAEYQQQPYLPYPQYSAGINLPYAAASTSVSV